MTPIYLDNAATTFPKPEGMASAMMEALTQYGANPGRSGYPMAMETARKLYRCREKAAEFFGGMDPRQVIFTHNATHGLNLAIHGVLRPGDHVLLSDLEHNSVLRPVWAMHRRQGVRFDTFPVFEGDTPRTVAACADRIRPNTRLIVCTHASNVFGIKLPAKELAALAHRRGCLFLLDASQTAGVEEIPFWQWGLDLLACPGHKGLYGPGGTGLLLVREGLRLRPLMQGGTGSDSANPSQPAELPERLEAGTVNTMGILGLAASMEYLQKQGRKRLLCREMHLVQMLYENLSAIPGVELYTRYPREDTHAPLLSFNMEGHTGEETAEYLGKAGFALRGGLHCAPLAHRKMGTFLRGTCRVSPGIFTTEKEIKNFCEAIGNFSREKL